MEENNNSTVEVVITDQRGQGCGCCSLLLLDFTAMTCG